MADIKTRDTSKGTIEHLKLGILNKKAFIGCNFQWKQK